MALTTQSLRKSAVPGTSTFRVEDEDGMYLHVPPTGQMMWRIEYLWQGYGTELDLGPYPEISLSEARKKRSLVQRLIKDSIDPQTPAKHQNAEDESEALLHSEPLELIAYRLNRTPMPLITGASTREWMDKTPNRFAYRCMPMLIANQAGWLALLAHKITVVWDGGMGPEALKITCLEGPEPVPAVSVFGSGILTFTLPYLFRTPPGYNLIAQGPANMPKDAVSALTGIIETDWAESTFTMNWMITRPNHPVTFDIGEPICMVTPQRRYEVEHFKPVIRDIASDPELHADYLKWADSRRQFNKDLKIKDSEATKAGWQKHYAQGKTINNKRSTAHQNKLTLMEFTEEKKNP